MAGVAGRAVSDYEIFDTWRKGPAAVIRLFERVFGTLVLYGAPTPDQQHRTIDDLSLHIARLQGQVEKLKAENSTLVFDNVRLRRRNHELEACITKDSHNSSRPPSSDPLAHKRTKSLRERSGKAPGGQIGHRGHTRPLTNKPTRVVMHRPVQCRSCRTSLEASQVMHCERRQVIEIVPAKLKVIEHRAEVRRCGACGKVTKGAFPDGVRAPVQYGSAVKARALYLHQYQLLPVARTKEAMADLFGLQMSAGTVARSVEECARQLVETELKIKQKLRRATVIHADETGLRVTQKLHYIHVASTAHLTHYGYDARRGKAAIDEIGILPKYRGHLVHDGWWAYNQYTRCRHSLCVAHLLRELKFFAELSDEQKSWAEPLGTLLVEIKAAVAGALEAKERSLKAEKQSEFIARYEELLKAGMVINGGARERGHPKDQKEEATTASTSDEKQARNLLLRMERRGEEVLKFMTDFQVPFDNNQAERDLRMVKLQQKIGGCFRSTAGAQHFCRIRSYLSTMRKQGRGVLHVLDRACRGVPLSLRKRIG